MTTGRELESNLHVVLGLNNRRPDFRLRTKDGVFVRAATNVDVSEVGSLKRRQGRALALSATDAHSLWIDDIDDVAYYADSTTLYRAAPSGAGLNKVALAANLLRGRRLTYARVGNEVMFSDGITNRAIAADGTVRPLGATPLGATPTVAATTGGALTAGTYQFVFAFSNDGLEVSPATPPVPVTVAQNGAILITGLPATWPADAATLHIYCTPPNGDVYLLQRKLTTPVTSLTLVTFITRGMQCPTVGKTSLLPGSIMRFFGGRLYSAFGKQLWFSDPYMPALCTPTRGYVQFNEDISIVEVNDAGMYLSAEATYWLVGDILTTEAKIVSPARGVFGTGGRHRALQQCFWMSDRGFVVADNAGTVSLLQEESVAVSPAASGAALFRDADGQRQLIAALANAPGTSTAARSYMDAEIVRKERIFGMNAMDNTHVGFEYLVETFKDGELVDSFTVHNLMPTEGVNAMLNTMFKSASQVGTWYIGLYEGNYTPVIGDTAATFPGAATETTAYIAATRVAWVPGTPSAGILDNSASKAEFDMNAAKTIYGAFMSSASAKGATSGVLVSAVRFPSPRVLDSDSILKITAGITLTSV